MAATTTTPFTEEQISEWMHRIVRDAPDAAMGVEEKLLELVFALVDVGLRAGNIDTAASLLYALTADLRGVPVADAVAAEMRAAAAA